MVATHSLKIRFLAVFVIAFVCLNAMGAVCVAYCRTSSLSAHETQHELVKKVVHHCDKMPVDPVERAIGAEQFDCCPMTVGFLGAPIEKSSFQYEPILAAFVSSTSNLPALLTPQSVSGKLTAYAGPPPRDRRPDRLKHRLLRI